MLRRSLAAVAALAVLTALSSNAAFAQGAKKLRIGVEAEAAALAAERRTDEAAEGRVVPVQRREVGLAQHRQLGHQPDAYGGRRRQVGAERTGEQHLRGARALPESS